MEFKGYLSSAIPLKIGTYITLESDSDLVTECEKFKDKKLSIEIKLHREKRSLDANAYAWTTMSKIATALKTDKDSIYELMLQKYGTPYLDENGISEKITAMSSIDVSKFGLHTKFIGNGYVGDKEFSHYIVIKGSSEYNTKEMADFIDGIVLDAQELGIDMLPPDEIRIMKERWGV